MKYQVFLCCALMAKSNFLPAMQLMRTPYQKWLHERRIELERKLDSLEQRCDTQVHIDYCICDSEDKIAYIAATVRKNLILAKFLNYTECDLSFGQPFYEKGIIQIRPQNKHTLIDMVLKKWHMPESKLKDQLFLYCQYSVETATSTVQIRKKIIEFTTDGLTHIIHHQHDALLNTNTERFFRPLNLPVIIKDFF